MKHIKNSIKGSIALLEHSGIPVSLVTDFNETIVNGSLCVDTTNDDLYILKNSVWTKYGAGFSGGNFIPIPGTDLNNPVTGDIETTDGVKIYNNTSSVTFTDFALHLGYRDFVGVSDNDLELSDNVVFKKAASIVSANLGSKDNFVFSVVSTDTSSGVFLGNNSANNILFTSISKDFILDASNDNHILGNPGEASYYYLNTKSFFRLFSDTQVIAMINNEHVEFDVDIKQEDGFYAGDNVNTRVTGIVGGTQAGFNQNQNTYLEGSFVDTNYTSNTFHNFYGGINNTDIVDCDFFYNLGHIVADVYGDYTLDHSTSAASQIVDVTNFYNLGILGNVNLDSVANYTFIGKNSNIISSISNKNFFYNVNGFKIWGESDNNIMFNMNNSDFFHHNIYSQLYDSSNNFMFNNMVVYSTSGNYNFVANTTRIVINGGDNFIYASKRSGQGVLFNVLGNNNLIYSVQFEGRPHTLGSHNFIFGDVHGESYSGEVDNTTYSLGSGNILLGNVNFNNTLSNNNIVLGAKRFTNVIHGGQSNNIFLNVDNFDVPDSNTVYLPFKFYSVYNGYTGLFLNVNITEDRTWIFPDKSGVVAFLDDITAAQNMLVDLTYSDLLSRRDAGTLLVGVKYRFDFQTIHVIPYTTDLHTGDVETLIVVASGTNAIDKLAYSPAYPLDIIYYDIDQNIVNTYNIDTDVDSVYSPTTDRPGRIYYREDTEFNLSTPYDFRNVVFRRYALGSSTPDTSTITPYTDGTPFYVGDVTTDGGGNYYMSKTVFTCDTSGILLNNAVYFMNITDFTNDMGWTSPAWVYISPTPDNYALTDTISYPVNNGWYANMKTFGYNRVTGGIDVDINHKFYNCHIRQQISAHIEQENKEYYPNIVFTGFCNGVEIGYSSENITLYYASNFHIGNACKNLYIEAGVGVNNITSLGDSCSNITIKSSNMGNDNCVIGHVNSNIIASNIFKIDIGSYNTEIFMFGAGECSIGNDNRNIGFFSQFTFSSSGLGVGDSLVGNMNKYVSFDMYSFGNIVGNNNNTIYLTNASHNNKIGDNNSYITGILTAVDSVEGITLGSAMFNNVVGNGCTSITIAGHDNVFGDNVTSVGCTEFVNLIFMEFGGGSGNINFEAGTNGDGSQITGVVMVTGTKFFFNNVYLGSQQNLILNHQVASINFLNFNISSGGMVYATRVDSWTDPNTYTNSVIPLIFS